MTFLTDLLKDKPISELSKRLYIRNLHKLNQNQPVVNLDFLKNTDEILNIISKYKPTTKRSFIIAIISVVKNDPELYKTYFDLLTQMNGQLKLKTFEQIYDIKI